MARLPFSFARILGAGTSSPTEEQGGFGLAVLAMLAGGLILLVLTLAADPVEGHYLVVGAPFGGGYDVLSAIAGAEGQVASAGGFDNMMLAFSDRPEFPEALQAAGAWLVLPAPRAFGCGPQILSMGAGA